MLAWLLVGLVALITVANFVDFLIDDRGDKQIRDKLYDFYMLIGGDWRRAARGTASLVADYLDQVLGRSWTAVIRITIVSLAITITLLAIGYEELEQKRGITFNLWFAVTLGSVLCLTNVIGDLISWSAARLSFRIVAQDNVTNSMTAILMALISAMFAPLLSVILIAFPLMLSAISVLSSDVYDRGTVILLYIGTNQFFWIIPFVTFFPLGLFFISLFVGLALRTLEPFAKRPLMFIVERLEKSPKHILTLAATLLAAVVSIVAAVGKAASTI